MYIHAHLCIYIHVYIHKQIHVCIYECACVKNLPKLGLDASFLLQLIQKLKLVFVAEMYMKQLTYGKVLIKMQQWNGRMTLHGWRRSCLQQDLSAGFLESIPF